MKKPSAGNSRSAPTPIITLKVTTVDKRQLQARARREKKSLNAYMLGKVAVTDVNQRGRVDYEKLTAHLGDKFKSMELWKLVLDRS